MCVVIIDGSEENGFLESGVDIFNLPEDILNGGDITLDNFIENFGEGKAFPSGPECVFRGNSTMHGEDETRWRY